MVAGIENVVWGYKYPPGIMVISTSSLGGQGTASHESFRIAIARLNEFDKSGWEWERLAPLPE